MKLNKEICKQCTDEFYGETLVTGKAWPGWNESNEYNWNINRMIWCHYAPTITQYETPRSINIIPDWCKYKLEHVVMK